ncbi:hypothetical protein M5K25_003091 [Dendrobium thyrsiflorum]|uniref:Uncharacterized protein n=1 Tax=Dendrobium thyrsiflorum TaxID=117978 RepID=A0ABD0VPE7_DENTH
MANPPQPLPDGIADDFVEQILSILGYTSGNPGLSKGDGSGVDDFAGFPLVQNLEQGRPGFARLRRVQVELGLGGCFGWRGSGERRRKWEFQIFFKVEIELYGDSSSDARSKQQIWKEWSKDGAELQVAKLIEEDVEAAMQFLHSKVLCMMPISLAAAFYHMKKQLDNPSEKPENCTHTHLNMAIWKRYVIAIFL